jgi:hypothetical protein
MRHSSMDLTQYYFSSHAYVHFKSRQTTGDYYSDVNYKKFET